MLGAFFNQFMKKYIRDYKTMRPHPRLPNLGLTGKPQGDLSLLRPLTFNRVTMPFIGDLFSRGIIIPPAGGIQMIPPYVEALNEF